MILGLLLFVIGSFTLLYSFCNGFQEKKFMWILALIRSIAIVLMLVGVCLIGKIDPAYLYS